MPDSHIVGARVYARNLIANWIGMGVETLVAFFLTPFVLSSLGDVRYGLWSLLNAMLGYFGLLDLGIRDGVGRFTAQYLARREPDRVREVVVTAGVTLTLLSLILIAAAALLGRYFPVFFQKTPVDLAPEVAVVLPIMAVGMWTTMVSSVLRSLLVAYDRFDLTTGIQTASTLLRAAGTVLVLRAGYGLVALGLVACAASLLAGLALLVAGERIFGSLGSVARHLSRDRLREIWRFGIANLVYRIANQLIYQTDQLLVMLFFGPAAVAGYGIASMLTQTGSQAVERIGSTFYPSVIRAAGLNDLDGLRRTFFWQARLAFLLGILVYVGFAAYGTRFCEVWLGPGYRSTATVLAVLSLAELASLMTSSGGSALFGLSRLRFNLVSSAGEAVLNLCLSLFFVAVLRIGMIGIALGTLTSALLWRGLLHPLYTSHVLGFGFREYLWRVGARVLLLAGLAYALFALAARYATPGHWGPFALAVAAGTAGYVPLAVLLLVPSEIRKTLRARITQAIRP